MKRRIGILLLCFVCCFSGISQELTYTFDKSVPTQWQNPERPQSGQLDVYPGLLFSNVWFILDSAADAYAGKVALAYNVRATSTGVIELSSDKLTSFTFRATSDGTTGVNLVVEVNGVPNFYNPKTTGTDAEYVIPFGLPSSTSVSITNRSEGVFYLYDLAINSPIYPNGMKVEKSVLPIVVAHGQLLFPMGDICIYSLAGIRLIHKANTDYCFLGGLKKGMYIAVWTNGSEKQTTKFCVYE